MYGPLSFIYISWKKWPPFRRRYFQVREFSQLSIVHYMGLCVSGVSGISSLVLSGRFPFQRTSNEFWCSAVDHENSHLKGQSRRRWFEIVWGSCDITVLIFHPANIFFSERCWRHRRIQLPNLVPQGSKRRGFRGYLLILLRPYTGFRNDNMGRRFKRTMLKTLYIVWFTGLTSWISTCNRLLLF